jgi:archaeal flagellin FlaB
MYEMGKKICNILRKKDIGAVGIGALIIFIAMVLIAGIAASVLIQTSTRLETQALRTGSQTITSVASGIMIHAVEGYNESGVITLLAIEIKPRAGSPDIDLDTTVIEISDSDTKYVLRYNDAVYTNSTSTLGNVFNTNFYPSGGDAPQTTFGIIVLLDADGSCTQNNPIINFGDHVVLAVGNAFDGIPPRQGVFGMVIPEEGSPGIIDFRTPESYNEAVMDLQ